VKSETIAMKRKNDKGFTLIELMVVITIIGLLAGITAVNVMSYLRRARVETTKEKMRTLKQAIQSFYIKHNKIPNTLADLCGPEGDDAREIEAEEPPKDAWNNEFIYQPKDKRNYDLMSYGADGMEGGTGEDKDITLPDLNKTTDDDEKK
jgi:general secretion pathway protein G